MPRNRYTKLVRKDEHIQVARQEKELVAIARRLRSQNAESTAVPVTNEAKGRRSIRVEQKRRHKPKRRDGAADTSQK